MRPAPTPTDADVQQAVRQTLSDGPGEYRLPDFLAAIDWSEGVRPPPEVADLLGRLELWDCEYREGDRGWDEFAVALVALDSEGRSQVARDSVWNDGGGPFGPPHNIPCRTGYEPPCMRKSYNLRSRAFVEAFPVPYVVKQVRQ